jgi:hypothetical protein
MEQYKGFKISQIVDGIRYSVEDFCQKERFPIDYQAAYLFYNEHLDKFAVVMENDKGNRIVYSGKADLLTTYPGYLYEINDDILNGYDKIYTY